MKTAAASGLAAYLMETVEGAAPVLVGTTMKGVVLDALTEMHVTQTYRNDEPGTIEAVYTFPLPLDAVLLDLEIRLGETTYRGEIMPRADAEQSYEKAIGKGDSAIMLENPQPGLYTMNVGNLRAGDECVISFRYGMFNHWQGDSLRICLPTVVAPRYGDPAAGNLQPHQAPFTELLAENPFSLSLRVKGAIAGASISCPSHGVTITEEGEGVTVELGKDASLDRDFVLEIVARGGLPVRGYSAADGERTLSCVPFHPLFAAPGVRPPLAITIVADCSGSMQGDSIAQAREAMQRIVDSLRPEDRFGMVVFGSTHVCYEDRLLPADSINLAGLREFVGNIGADMGGTELGAALKAAYRLGRGDETACVLLITDGQVTGWQKVATEARKSGQRVFTVGVGSAVTEAAVREIAEKSGGACELVSPREDMAGRIYRHFLRMQSPRGQFAAVNWIPGADQVWPDRIDRLFSGDTLHRFSWTFGNPPGEARLTVVLPEGGAYEQAAPISPCPEEIGTDTLSRVAAGFRLRECTDEKVGARLALDYRLMSPWTNCCAVIAREDSADVGELPALRRVAQMWPAGGNGAGTVMGDVDVPMFSRASECVLAYDAKFSMRSGSGDAGDYDVPAFLRRRIRDAADIPAPPPPRSGADAFWMLLREEDAKAGDILSIMPDDIRDKLLAFAGCGLKPEDAVVILLVRLFDSLDTVLYSKQLARRIRERYKNVCVPYEFDRNHFEGFVRYAVDLIKARMPSV